MASTVAGPPRLVDEFQPIDIARSLRRDQALDIVAHYCLGVPLSHLAVPAAPTGDPNDPFAWFQIDLADQRQVALLTVRADDADGAGRSVASATYAPRGVVVGLRGISDSHRPTYRLHDEARTGRTTLSPGSAGVRDQALLPHHERVPLLVDLNAVTVLHACRIRLEICGPPIDGRRS